MGCLHKRGEIYYADFVDRHGQRVQRSLRTRDREVARARLRDLELATTDSGPHATETVTAALDYFITIGCASKPRATRSSYEHKARHVARLLGGAKLDVLTIATVERYIAARIAEGAHPHSVHKELVVLRGALASAEARGTFHGVVGKVVPRFRAQYEPRTAYLMPEQLARLLANLVPSAAPNTTPATRAKLAALRDRRSIYVLLIVFAAPRRGELLRLNWLDVDLANNVLRVPKGKTKSRVVPIHPVLRPWLEQFRQPCGRLVAPWTDDKRGLARACERAGVPRVTPNDLRRTFATWLKQQDVDSAVVANMMGHNSTTMVDRVYGRIESATLQRAIAKLPEVLPAG